MNETNKNVGHWFGLFSSLVRVYSRLFQLSWQKTLSLSTYSVFMSCRKQKSKSGLVRALSELYQILDLRVSNRNGQFRWRVWVRIFGTMDTQNLFGCFKLEPPRSNISWNSLLNCAVIFLLLIHFLNKYTLCYCDYNNRTKLNQFSQYRPDSDVPNVKHSDFYRNIIISE